MKKRTFNWVDGVTIALAVLLIAGAAWYFLRGRKPATPEKDYLVTMRFTQATFDPYDYYKIGDTVYFYSRSSVMGKITSLRQLDTVYETFNRSLGAYQKVIDDKAKTLEVQVAVKGVIENGEFTVNGEKVFMGQTLYPQTDTTRSVMVVWKIEEVRK